MAKSGRVVDDYRYKLLAGSKTGPPPSICPLCGRSLEGFSWFGSNTEYPSLVCYNGMGRFMSALYRIVGLGTDPSGAHYVAELPSRPRGADIPRPFDQKK